MDPNRPLEDYLNIITAGHYPAGIKFEAIEKALRLSQRKFDLVQQRLTEENSMLRNRVLKLEVEVEELTSQLEQYGGVQGL
jgi:hypothetical protein